MRTLADLLGLILLSSPSAAHNAPSATKLPAQVRRDGKRVGVALDFPAGWRRRDISCRATKWDLRRMGLGGLKPPDLPGEQREERGCRGTCWRCGSSTPEGYGEHAVAKRDGFQKGGILVSFAGMSVKMSESDLLAYTMQKKRPGVEVAVTVLRNGKRETLKFVLQ